MKQPSDYREVDERLDTLIDNDYWSYPEDTRTMILTTKKIKELFHSELDRVREETIKACVKEVRGLMSVSRTEWEAMDELLTQLAKDNKQR